MYVPYEYSELPLVYKPALGLQLNTVIITLNPQDGSPPLHSAISGNHWEVVRLLIEKYHASPTDGATNVRILR